MGRRRAVVVLFALVAGLCAGRSVHAQTFLAPDESQSFALVNTARSALGLSRLTRRAELDAMARAQAARMAARGEIFHNPNLGSDADAAGLRWIRLGENVGVGPDVIIVHNAFLASPHHRDNMLYPPYNAIGVGIAPGTGAKSGLIFIAHVFGQLTGSAPVAATPAPPAPARVRAAHAMAPRPSAPVHAAVRATPRPTPVPAPSATPNAVIGGLVDPSAVLGAS
jgi:uncharacterized protein YkwD